MDEDYHLFEISLSELAFAAPDHDPELHAAGDLSPATERLILARQIAFTIHQAEIHLRDAGGYLPLATGQIDRNGPLQARAEAHRKTCSGLTMALIYLQHASFSLNAVGHRLDEEGPLIFKPRDPRRPNNPQDLAELIRVARNTACHVETELRLLPGGGSVNWMFVLPGSGATLRPDMCNGTNDDILVSFGNMQFYINAVLVRAVELGFEKCMDYVRTPRP